MVVLDLRKAQAFTDQFFICTGQNARQVKAIADAGLEPGDIGYEQAILVDTFPPAKRAMGMAVYGVAVVVAPILGHHYPTMQSSQEDKLWWLRASTWALRLFTSGIPCFLFLLWFEKYLRAFSGDPR